MGCEDRRDKDEGGDECSPETLAGLLFVLVGCEPGNAPGRDRHSSLMSRSSKSWHIGMIESIESDQTTMTLSSRCGNSWFSQIRVPRRVEFNPRESRALSVQPSETRHGMLLDIQSASTAAALASLPWHEGREAVHIE